MAEHRIPQQTRGESGGGEPVVIEMPSFTTPGISYVVTLYPQGSTCSCPAGKHATCHKHRETAPAIARINALPFGDGEKARLRERVLRLAKRIYTRPRKEETAKESYSLYLDTLRERFATERMRQRAYERHGEVQKRYFGPDRRAA